MAGKAGGVDDRGVQVRCFFRLPPCWCLTNHKHNHNPSAMQPENAGVGGGSSIKDDPVVRNAAETLEELKSIAQLLRLADKEANAKAEEFKKEGNDADLPAALRRRNKMRQGVQGVIEHMSELKALADEVLLLRGGGDDAGTADCEERVMEMCESSMDMVEVWRRVLPKESVDESEARGSSATRTAALDKELAAVRDTCLPHTATLLCSAITRLRGLEDTVSFHADLVKDVAEASSRAGYTKDNFAYGSTPFQTWRNVMQVPVVASAVTRCIPKSTGEAEGEYVVFGSSSGWMVFYGAIALGMKSRGVELMQHLDKSANLVLEELQQERKDSPSKLDLVFEKGDMLEADISKARILLLASQCWDGDLKEQVRAKAEAELSDGAVVIDYSDTIFGQSKVMRLAGEADGRVSWNENQRFFVYERV